MALTYLPKSWVVDLLYLLEYFTGIIFYEFVILEILSGFKFTILSTWMAHEWIPDKTPSKHVT